MREGEAPKCRTAALLGGDSDREAPRCCAEVTLRSEARRRIGLWYGSDMPSRDTQWVIGVIVAAMIALSTQIAGLHRPIDG